MDVFTKNINDRFAGAVPFLNAFARVLGGYFHLKSAIQEGPLANEQN